jgi:TBC1 domain family protein 5
VLCRILAVWCITRPHISYKQGMHELLGHMFLALYTDLRTPEAFALDPNITLHASHDRIDRTALLCDARYIEHDAFALFTALLESTDGPRALIFYADLEASAGLPVYDGARVFALLEHADPALAAHLDAMGVAPQLFLLRWLRLLFCREFQTSQVCAPTCEIK